MRSDVESFLRDRRGSVAMMWALLLFVIVGFTALGVDVGTIFTDRRKAQSTADLAAMAAVSDIANADKAAAATVQRNNLAPGTSYALQLGIYTADPKLTPANRFKPSAGGNPNAAQVTVNTSTPLFFGRVLTGKNSFQIQTTATATRTALATFAIGSRLLQVNGGLLNQVLGGLLGSSLSLSAMDYQSLISANVDLFGFMNALATRMQVTAGTYDSLLNTNANVGDVLKAMVDTERQSYGGTSAAVQASSVAQALQSSTSKVPVRSIVDAGPYDSMSIGQTPKVGASVSALDMLTAVAQIANGQHQVQAALNLNVPGIAAASLQLAIGERPRGTSWVTVGAEGASVHTAQTRLLLLVQLIGSAPASVVNVPIYIEIASGTATLNAPQCGFPDVSTSTVTLGVTPGVIDAWIGNVSNAQFADFTSAPNPPAATLVNTPLLQVTGRAHVSVSNLSATAVTFSYQDIQQAIKKTVGTTDYASSLLSSLVGNTQFGVSILGLGIGLPQTVTGLVSGILTNAVSPIDQLLSSVLQTVGVGLGQADVWVSGIRCDGAVLVI